MQDADLKAQDAVRAAALLLEAVEAVEDRTLETVRTAYGTADVVVDEGGVDMHFHDRDATVHVRRENPA